LASARTILVVDPTDAADRLVDFCSDHGLTVLRAHKAETGLEILLSGAPEVAIIEVDLPDASGLDFAEVLSGERIPLFFASENHNPEDNAALDRALGTAAGFLEKPYELDLVMIEIAHALEVGLKEIEVEAAARVDEVGRRWGRDDVADEAPVPQIEAAVDEETGLSATAAEGAGSLLEVVADASAAVTDTAAAPSEDEPAVATTDEEDEEVSGDAPTEAIAERSLDEAAEEVQEADRRTRTVIEAWERKIAGYRQSSEGRLEDVARSGSLAQTSVVQLFTFFHQNRLSGELALTRERAKRLVLFSQGYPVFARSNLARERLGAQLVSLGMLTEAQLRQALEAVGGSDKRLGDVLVGEGFVTDSQRRKVLTRSVRHIVLAAFAWHDGEYRVGLVERARNQSFMVPMFTGNVILRGLALTTPLDTLRWAVPRHARFAPVADPIYPLELMNLNDREARVLISVDGTKTVAELFALFRVDERTLLGLLYGLTKLNLLELVGHGAARPRPIEFF